MFIELAFGILGGGIKFVDDALDEGIFNKKIAIMVAPFLVALWILLCLQSKYAATILTAILLSVILGGKIDNKVGILSVMPIFGSLVFFIDNIFLMPLILLTILGIIDEKGNDYVDRNKTNFFMEFFFKHRFCMKIGVALLSFFEIFPLQYFIAFLLFDISYDTMHLFGKYRIEKHRYRGNFMSFIFRKIYTAS